MNGTLGVAAVLAAAATGWWFLRGEVRVPSPPPRPAPRVREAPRPVVAPPRVTPPPPPAPVPAPPALPPGEGEEDAPPAPDPEAPLADTAIAGVMAPSSGRPLPAGFKAVVFLETDASKAAAVVPVRPDGTFATGALLRGESYLVVGRTAMGFTAGRVPGVLAGTRDLKVPLEPGGTISGRVLDADGKPAGRGVLVTASIPNPAPHRGGSLSTALTDDEGNFVVEYLGKFIFSVVAQRGRHRGSGSDHQPGTTNLEIRLE